LVVLGGILAWFAVGVAAVCYVVYKDKTAFRAIWDTRKVDHGECLLVSAAGPLAAVALFAMRLFGAADRARVNQQKLRDELERELAEARKEIDAILNRERTP
jgi:hypothetical protein